MARESGLSFDDMKLMDVGDVLDYVYSWIDLHDIDTKKKKTRKATQADIDRVFYNG